MEVVLKAVPDYSGNVTKSINATWMISGTRFEIAEGYWSGHG
jgi:hypothetical protein